MREAMGGAWLYGVVIVFIAIFVSFLAYSISYTRAFNAKNEIINLIEKREGWTAVNNSSIDVKNLSDDELKIENSVESLAFLGVKNTGYNYSVAEKVACASVGYTDPEAGKAGGYCVQKCCRPDAKKDSQVYYSVTTFITAKIPILEVTFKIPIRGETKTIFTVNRADHLDCSDCSNIQ